MSGYVTRVRELLAQRKKLTLPEIFLHLGDLQRREISSALSYLMKTGNATREKIDNEGGIGRRNVYQYTYQEK